MKDWREQLKTIQEALNSKDEDTQPTEASSPGKSTGQSKNLSSSNAKRPAKGHARPIERNLGASKKSHRQSTKGPKFPLASKVALTHKRAAPPPPIKSNQFNVENRLAKPQKFESTPTQLTVEQPVPSTFKSIKPSTLTRQDQYIEPPAWVNEGRNLTIEEVANSKPGVDIFIGIDFGTSYTKAAVGFMDAIFPVRWDGAHNASDALTVPSEYSILPSGQALLGQHPSATRDDVLVNLKHPFLNPAVSRRSICDAAVFLALILRYVRAWTFHQHGDVLRKRKLNWIVNLGMPSNGLEDEKLKIAYTRLVNLGWHLSLLPTIPARLDSDSAQVLLWMDETPSSMAAEPGLVPEFLAQIAGYVQSSQRANGLHCLVDVGGGSLDVATFSILHRDDEDKFPIWVPEVRPLGVHMLLQNRLVGATALSSTQIDPLAGDMSEKEFAERTKISDAQVQARDRLFTAEVERLVRSVVAKTKTRRYKLSPAWSNGLRVFMSGGGASLNQYRAPVDRGIGHVAQRVDLIDIPRHNKVAEHLFPKGTYHRISVACGLAQDNFNFGRLLAAKDIEDDTALGTIRVRPQPDRDELYPK